MVRSVPLCKFLPGSVTPSQPNYTPAISRVKVASAVGLRSPAIRACGSIKLDFSSQGGILLVSPM